MNAKPTIYVTCNGNFLYHLVFNDGVLFERFPLDHPESYTLDPGHIIHCSPDLIDPLAQAYPHATIQPSSWTTVDLTWNIGISTDSAGHPIRFVAGSIGGKNWGMGTCFHIWHDGKVTTGFWQGMVLLSPKDEEAKHSDQDPENIRWSISDETPDPDRAAIIAWLDSHGCRHSIHPSQAAAKESTLRRKQEFDAKWKAEQIAKHEAATRPQREDSTIIGMEPVVPTYEQCYIHLNKDGERRKVFRIKATGFSCISDWDGKGDWNSLLESQGCTIHYACDAINPHGGYAGTWAAPIMEISYTLPDGQSRYAYVAITTTIDDWQQEIWTSDTRLSASAAADTIVAARKLAHSS